MQVARVYGGLSHARRLKVGAVLVKDDRIISIGYNGMPSGGTNTCEEYVLDGPIAELVTKPGVVHAEMNVIAFAAKNGVSTEGCTMIVTDSPCYECSKLIIQSGIKKIYYDKEYRLTESLDFLREYGVKVERFEEKSGKTKVTGGEA